MFFRIVTFLNCLNLVKFGLCMDECVFNALKFVYEDIFEEEFSNASQKYGAHFNEKSNEIPTLSRPKRSAKNLTPESTVETYFLTDFIQGYAGVSRALVINNNSSSGYKGTVCV